MILPRISFLETLEVKKSKKKTVRNKNLYLFIKIKTFLLMSFKIKHFDLKPRKCWDHTQLGKHSFMRNTDSDFYCL